MRSENFDFILVGDTGPVYDVSPRYVGARGGKGYPAPIPAVSAELDVLAGPGQLRLFGSESASCNQTGSEGSISALREFGGSLFAALFPSDISGAFEAKFGSARVSGNALRIGINLDGAPALARLPWEALYSKGTDRLLGVDHHSNIVRLLSPRIVGRAPENLKRPVKLLVVISNPEGDLKAKEEVEAISRHLTSTLGKQALFALTVIENVSSYRLNVALYEHKPDILHYIGHGGFDGEAGVLLLCAEDDPSHAAALDTQALGDNLVNYPPKIVVLNSCQGATAAPGDRYAGTAQSLIGMGIPYVVAMQFPISDVAANVFAERFYAALSEGSPVESAVTLGRSAIRARSPGEFVTPVLYCGCEEGGLKVQNLPDVIKNPPASSKGLLRWVVLIASGISVALALGTVFLNHAGDNPNIGVKTPNPSWTSDIPPSPIPTPNSRPSPFPVSVDGQHAVQHVTKIKRQMAGAPTNRPPPPPPPPPPVQMQPCGTGPFIVFFDWNRSDLKRDEEASAILEQAADAIKNCPNSRVLLSGYADTSGQQRYNVRLSAERSELVARELQTLGIDRGSISTQAYGESNILVPTADGVREPQNRRVEIEVYSVEQASEAEQQPPQSPSPETKSGE